MVKKLTLLSLKDDCEHKRFLAPSTPNRVCGVHNFVWQKQWVDTVCKTIIF